MYEAARWLAVEARYMRSCWGSPPRITVKNGSGTHEFPFSYVGASLLPIVEKASGWREKNLFRKTAQYFSIHYISEKPL